MPLAFPKPRAKILEKREAKSALEAKDRAERKKCHLRSGGRCEIQTAHFKPEISELHYRRCQRRAIHNHHLVSGTGKRNVGRSILAEHRLDVCQLCHQDLHAELLTPLFSDTDFKESATQVKYERRER